MKNKIISIFLSLAIVISVFSVIDFSSIIAEAADIKNCGDYEYVELTSKTAAITSYLGNDRNVVIPSEIAGLSVVEIYDYCFNGESVKTVYSTNGFTKPDELKKHPNKFYNNRIKTVTIPSTVKTIGTRAFGEMKNLQNVVFSEGIVTIKAFAFANCNNLQQINLPDSLVDFNLNSFEGTSVTEIVLGNNVKRPVLSEYQGSNVRRLICNADKLALDKLSMKVDSSLEEIVCNGSFLGGNLKGSPIKRVICNSDVPYSTVLVMAASDYVFCSDTESENVIFSVSESDMKKMYISADFEYYLNEKSEAVISRYIGKEKNVTVPKTLDNHTVTTIAPLGFSSLSFIDVSAEGYRYKEGEKWYIVTNNLLSVTLPDTIKTIGDYAFAYNGSLEKVNIPSGVSEIPQECFFGCKKMVNMYLPDSVREIGSSAFEGCEVLESVEMRGVVNVGDKAFYQCNKLVDVIFSDSLKSIGSSALQYCKLTETLDLSSVEQLGKNVFSQNSTIKKVILNDNLQVLESGVFYYCRNLEEINFPSELVSIGSYCFENSGIRNVVLGGKVKEIGEKAFESCRSLAGTIDLSTVEKIGEGAFSWSTGIQKVILCDNLKTLEKDTFKVCAGLKEINFPSALTQIKKSCFGSSGIRTATFGENLREIGIDAFGGCTRLSVVEFSEGLEIIGSDAFLGCKLLTVIELPESIMKIGNFAFEGTGVKILTIPKNLSVIGYAAFQDCKSLETLYFNAINCTVDKYMNNSTDLNLDNLKNSAPFYGCNIKNIYLGAGITSIGGTSDTYGTFENCESLEEIMIPDTVSKIGKASFKNCYSLELAVISDSVTSVADDAFEGCDNLTILCFEDSYIYEYAQNNGIAVSTFLVSPIPNQTYTGKKITPEVTVTFSGDTLHKYIDFGVTFANNINVGEADVTVKGKGDYKNFSNKTRFTIVTKDISSATISAIADQAWTGDAVIPELIVTDSSVILKEGVDYTTSFSDNKKEGTATVVVTGKGNYSGGLSAKFNIVKMTDTENFFSRLGSSIKAFFIRIGAFFANIFGK
ncbi:MAG: leucine-rich repeat domain-containing protein [Clostridia bacterium]|nr:leucine-rich repeat domain-containing protein [Clostridia bacterium]